MRITFIAFASMLIGACSAPVATSHSELALTVTIQDVTPESLTVSSRLRNGSSTLIWVCRDTSVGGAAGPWRIPIGQETMLLLYGCLAKPANVWELFATESCLVVPLGPGEEMELKAEVPLPVYAHLPYEFAGSHTDGTSDDENTCEEPPQCQQLRVAVCYWDDETLLSIRPRLASPHHGPSGGEPSGHILTPYSGASLATMPASQLQRALQVKTVSYVQGIPWDAAILLELQSVQVSGTMKVTGPRPGENGTE